MDLGEDHRISSAPPPWNRSKRRGEGPARKNLPRVSKMNLDGSLGSQLGETISEKDKAFRRKLECSKQRFIEHEDHRQIGVCRECRVVIA